jgi:hypothetical protein
VCAVVFDHERFRHRIARSQLNHPMAATAAAGTGWKVEVIGDAGYQGRSVEN